MRLCECCKEKKHGVRTFKVRSVGRDVTRVVEVSVCATCADDFQIDGTQANLWLRAKSADSVSA